MQTRRATMEDMFEMQHVNLRCLPENYNMRYYLYHYLSWPQMLYISEDYNGKTAGYVLAKMDDEEDEKKVHGHITSLSVLRSHRKLGVATCVMKAAMEEMDVEYGAHFCSLHVRRTNEAALHLYQDTLSYRCAEVEVAYYADGEDGMHMKKFFKVDTTGSYVLPTGQLERRPPVPLVTAAGRGGGGGGGGAKEIKVK